jgi:Tfp pilus assembly protein PilX
MPDPNDSGDKNDRNDSSEDSGATRNTGMTSWSHRSVPRKNQAQARTLQYEPNELCIQLGVARPRYRIESFPSLFVIDQQSKIVGVVRHSEHARLESLVRTLLAKSEPPRPN